MKRTIRTFIGLVLVAVIAAGSALYLVYYTEKLPQVPVAVKTTAINHSNIYQNDKYGFSITLPEYYTVKDYNESGFDWISFHRETTNVDWLKVGQDTASVFDIFPYTHERFAQLKSDCATQGAENIGPACAPFLDGVVGHKVIGTNNKYDFIFVRVDKSTDYPADFTQSYFDDAERVIKTFIPFDVQ